MSDEMMFVSLDAEHARHNYDRLLQLADRSQLGHAHRVPELPPKMGLRVKDKSRLSTGALEQSLPDKLTQALRNLRPGALVHSASSSAAHSSKSGVVPADDVVYIASPEASQISSHFEEMRRRRHSAMMRLCPSQSPSPVLMRNAYRREHGHPRGMFKSVPNVNVVEEKEKEYRRRRRRSCHVFGDEADAESSSTRSPTDSGYRSTPRQTSGENLCTYDEISPTRISHKTTTVVYVNGESSNAEDNQVVKAHGASHTALDSHLLRFGVVCKDPGCPFDERDLITLLNRKSLSKDSQCFDVSYVPRLIDMLLNTLEIITDHVQRLSINSAKATVENVTTTTKRARSTETKYVTQGITESFCWQNVPLAGDKAAQQANLRIELDPMVAISEKDLLEAINDSRGREVMETNGFLLSSKGKQRSLIQMSSSGLQCLRYFILNQSGRSNVVPIADWTRIIFAFAEHRMSHTVDETDVQQAARVLLGCDCAPPSVSVSCRDFSDLSLEDAKKEFAFSLAASASPMHMQHVSSLLDGQWSATNQFGLCLTSAAVLRSDGDALQRLIDMGFPTNVPIPASIGDKRPFLLVEYSGWTPLTWAVATRNTMCTDILLASKAQVQSDDMIKESPIQVAAQQGCEDVVRRLLCAGADPFRSTIEYDSSKASFRSIGSPSALAIACSRGHSLIVDIFVDRLLQNFPTTVIDFLSDSQTKVKDIGKIEFKRLPKNTRLALQEALYYAVETSQPECALQLWKCGGFCKL
ncbi:ankyrin repeat protein [Ancylostoma ceylanicum]|uniref:Ankyrin repeat protein n=1 Tax=Ancylostoma ceylanicum TaxID=53326 RepID=A0A0D6L6L7_9BILA|nr:ankyrin repeat protein [Ancylostoma ceylanicum]